ncbi:carR [Janibacter sp. HTCC2649]|nr:carR [Janibacter sp. HTCC2649]
MRSSRTRSSAAEADRSTRVIAGASVISEEPELVRAVADQEVLGLLVVVEHHLVVLAADAGLLVATERGVRGVLVVAVDPDASRFDPTTHPVCRVRVSRPDAGSQPVEGVVGDPQGVVAVGELRDRQDGPEDLLLEDAHRVVALEHGRLDVVAALEPVDGALVATGEDLGALLLADVEVAEDLLVLVVARLGADHDVGVERVAHGDGVDPGDGLLHELVIDRLLHEGTRGAGADLALVEREHREALERLVEERVVGRHDVREEDVGALAAELEGHRDDVLRGVLHDQPPGRRLAGERDLVDARVGREGLAGLDAEAVDHVEDTVGEQVGDDLDDSQDRRGRLLGRLEDDAVAGRERGSELPRRHEDGEVPRDDLTDDAEGLVEVVGHRVVVDLGDPALLGADASSEVAEVVDRERKVGGEGLADRLAVLPGLEHGELLEVLLEPVGDLEQDVAPLRRRRATPGVLGVRGGLDGGVDVGCLAASHHHERLAVDWRDVLERLAILGRDPLAADEVVELRGQNHLRAVRIGGCKHHDRTSLSLR